MSFFDDASLSFLPSGAAGKDGKAYSIKPVPEFGSEKVTNGTFSTDSDWTKGTGWTISGGTASCDGSQSGNSILYQNISHSANKKYRVEFTISGYVSGQVDFALDTPFFGATTSNGTFIFDAIPPSGGNFIIRADADFVGSIDNVSVKEITKTGDFTFSRGSNLAATRVGADGLIEKGRENLLLQSNQFDTTWTGGATTLSSQSGYDGTNDAWLITKSNTFDARRQLLSYSGVNTFSIYAKSGSYNFVLIHLDSPSGDCLADFDLSTGTLGSLSNGITSKIEDVGNGWYRCIVTAESSFTDARIYPSETGGYTGTSGSIYIQSAQLEIGLAATDVISTGATTGKAGLLEDEPRFDYSGGATCPSLLLEGSRTNIIGYSEYLSGLSLFNSPTITQNYAVSPEGVQNAVRIQDTDGTNFKTIQTQFSISAGSTYTISVYVKKATSPITTYGAFYFDFDGGTRKISDLIFDEYNGTLVNALGNNITSVIHPVIDEGDYWRFSATATDTGSNTLLRATLRAGASANGTSLSLVTKDYTAYGFQCEQGSYPTSYIPNHSGGSVTRGADVCTGAGDATTFNDSEGVLYAEISALANDGTFRNISVSNGTTAQAIRIYYRSNDDQITFLLGSSSGGGITTSIPSATDYIKVAAKYDTDTIKLFVNGALINTISSLTMPTGLQQLDFNIANVLPFYGNAKQVLYFPTALSDADCITLTTL